jgi:hypothetical protein
LLEILCYKMVVCAHLRTVDCAFVVKGVQIIIQHVTLLMQEDRWYNTAEKTLEIIEDKKRLYNCIGYLSKMGVHFERSLYFMKVLSAKDTNITATAVPTVLTLPENIHPLKGYADGTMYS